jgi:hypothetical protein
MFWLTRKFGCGIAALNETRRFDALMIRARFPRGRETAGGFRFEKGKGIRTSAAAMPESRLRIYWTPPLNKFRAGPASACSVWASSGVLGRRRRNLSTQAASAVKHWVVLTREWEYSKSENAECGRNPDRCARDPSNRNSKRRMAPSNRRLPNVCGTASFARSL